MCSRPPGSHVSWKSGFGVWFLLSNDTRDDTAGSSQLARFFAFLRMDLRVTFFVAGVGAAAGYDALAIAAVTRDRI